MTVLPSLTKSLDLAWNAVLHHPKHDLTLGHRHLIWSLLGPRVDLSSTAQDKIGYRRRVHLAMHTAKKVLPIWQQVWTNDETPRQVLAIAEEVMDGQYEIDLAWMRRDEVSLYLDNLVYEFQDLQMSIAAGFAAMAALTTALQDEQFDAKVIDLTLTDAEVDADELDSSYCAAAAYAGGTIWDDGGDNQKRKEFWEWWLKHAVAFAVATT